MKAKVDIHINPKKRVIVHKDISMQEEMNAISASFRDEFNDDSNDVVSSGSVNYWIVDTYDAYIIVEDSKDGDYFKVPYSVSEDDYTFSPKSDWVEVERKYVESESKKELIVHKGCGKKKKKKFGDKIVNSSKKKEEDEDEED